jgi:hypothetical protein
MSLVVRRAARVARTRSVGVAARAVAREVGQRRAELQLTRAARRGEPILAGPFVGEVGYELLYWIPFLRRVLRDHAVPPERVTVLTRGGAGAWYADLAARAIEILDLLPPDAFRRRLLERRARAGDAKQIAVDPFDRELASLALERTGPAHLLHPRLMLGRLRYAWEGLVPPVEAARLADYEPLPQPSLALPAELPAEYVAVKLYFNDPFPETPETRAYARMLVERLARDRDVVVLTSGLPLDEHVEWSQHGGRIHDASSWLEPRDNLAVQSRLVAGASALVSTYGGFSYLGPFMGTRTLALSEREPHNDYHLQLMRVVNPGVEYVHAWLDESDAVEAFLAGAALGARV